MRKISVIGIIVCIAILLASKPIADPTAAEIIKKAEEKMNGKTTTSELVITILRPKWNRTMKMKIWSKGTKYSMILLTAPVKEKGTVFLKRDKEVWNWLPSIERTIKLPPSVMGQSWMGTDLSNDDLVRADSKEDDYTHTLLGKEEINGRECYKISSVPGEDVAVVWGKIVSWIDLKDYIQMKAEFYDEDDELINTFKANSIKTMGGKTIATLLEIIPADKPKHKTIMMYKNIVWDKPISDNFFTTQNMKKVK
jgi:outer membrane lipoprotein-sorting protein